MESADRTNRHLLDICRKSDCTGAWMYSGFLSPAEQDDFIRCPDAARFDWRFDGGYETAKRKILAAGNEDAAGCPPDPPSRVIAVRPASRKFAENLSHRDYLGAILSLGIDRSLTGDILVRKKEAWFFCMDSAADFLISSLTRIRNTTVSASLSSAEAPELQPRYEPLRLNVAVFVNSRTVTDKSVRLKDGDILSVRGFGKAVYDGIEYETRKSRLWVSLRKYV